MDGARNLGRLALPGHYYEFDANELRTADGARVPLRPQCLEVLRCLALAAGELVTKDQLMATVWPDVVVTEDSLVQCIGALRKALGDTAQRTVQTVPRRGYRLLASPEGRCDPVGGATSAADAPVAVLQCARKLPAGAKLNLLWEAGIESASGVAVSTPQALAYKVRPAFSARLRCEKTHANLIEMVEKALISKVLEQCGYNQVKAARMLGTSRNTLRHRMKKFHITPPADQNGMNRC